MIQHAGHGKVDAVGGGAVNIIETTVGFAQAERAIKRERVAGAAAVALWGDYGDIGKGGKCFGKAGQARSEITVIVTQQNPHR